MSNLDKPIDITVHYPNNTTYTFCNTVDKNLVTLDFIYPKECPAAACGGKPITAYIVVEVSPDYKDVWVEKYP